MLEFTKSQTPPTLILDLTIPTTHHNANKDLHLMDSLKDKLSIKMLSENLEVPTFILDSLKKKLISSLKPKTSLRKNPLMLSLLKAENQITSTSMSMEIITLKAVIISNIKIGEPSQEVRSTSMEGKTTF